MNAERARDLMRRGLRDGFDTRVIRGAGVFTIKTGPTLLYGARTAIGGTNATLQLIDGVDANGLLLADFNLTTLQVQAEDIWAFCRTGLVAVSAGGVAADYTIMYI